MAVTVGLPRPLAPAVAAAATFQGFWFHSTVAAPDAGLARPKAQPDRAGLDGPGSADAPKGMRPSKKAFLKARSLKKKQKQRGGEERLGAGGGGQGGGLEAALARRAPPPRFGETVDAPLHFQLKRKHWAADKARARALRTPPRCPCSALPALRRRASYRSLPRAAAHACAAPPSSAAVAGATPPPQSACPAPPRLNAAARLPPSSSACAGQDGRRALHRNF